jgi:hypothetical protein
MFKTTAGETVKFSTVISDMNSAVADPVGGVTFMIHSPSGTVSTYIYGTDVEIIKASTGKYSINLDVAEVGTYTYRWKTMTPAVSIKEDTILVVAALF